MGLWVSKEIVAKYNGKITFNSEYLKGSSFSFNFDLEDIECSSYGGSDFLLQLPKESYEEEELSNRQIPRPYVVKPESPKFKEGEHITSNVISNNDVIINSDFTGNNSTEIVNKNNSTELANKSIIFNRFPA